MSHLYTMLECPLVKTILNGKTLKSLSHVVAICVSPYVKFKLCNNFFEFIDVKFTIFILYLLIKTIKNLSAYIVNIIYILVLFLYLGHDKHVDFPRLWLR